MIWPGEYRRSQLVGIWESEFGFCRAFFFAGLFAGHFVGLSPASFSPTKNPTKGTKQVVRRTPNPLLVDVHGHPRRCTRRWAWKKIDRSTSLRGSLLDTATLYALPKSSLKIEVLLGFSKYVDRVDSKSQNRQSMAFTLKIDKIID